MSELLHDGWMILAALLPSIGLVYLFFVIIKHMVEGDRRERAALREMDRADSAAAGGTPPAEGRDTPPSSGA